MKQAFKRKKNKFPTFALSKLNKMNKMIQESIIQLSKTDTLQCACHRQEKNHPLPSLEIIKEIVHILRSIIFPGYFGDSKVNPENISKHIEKNIEQLQSLLTRQIKSGMCFEDEKLDFNCENLERETQMMVAKFIRELPEIREKLHSDVISVYNGDPAAKNFGEIIFCYPGIKAITNYRIAHSLLTLGVPVLPRIITEMAHSETGIDIHPAAKIGHFFTIDHGTGIVIGETAVIGDNVKMYQGVTLGAKNFPLDAYGNPIKGIDRHPKIGNNVVIYSNSTILGTIKVGDGAVIGGNLWVDTDVPAGAKLSQKGRKEEINGLEEKKHKKDKHHKHGDKKKEEKEEKKSFKYDNSAPVIKEKIFKPCKGCSSKYGCKKCRDKWEKKHGKIIDLKMFAK